MTRLLGTVQSLEMIMIMRLRWMIELWDLGICSRFDAQVPCFAVDMR